MGTRHLTMVQHKGEIRIAQYGQWDGYPIGQGKTIVHFIQDSMDINLFKKNIEQIKEISEEDLEKLWIKCGATKGDSMVDLETSSKFENKYPHLHRDCGANILHYIQNGIKEVQNQLDFAKDSLFCEWGYIINLDTKKLEVYQGFNKKPLTKKRSFLL
jgi:hypothetical protein